jgi:hypothetical protein
MKKIGIVAHFLSANLGDRYQGTGIANLINFSNLTSPISYINSHEMKTRSCLLDLEESPSFSQILINCPSSINWEEYDYLIMPSGSIDGNSRFVEICLQALNSKKLKQIYIWGGFHDLTNDMQTINPGNESLVKVVSDERVWFFARGWLELAIYNMLSPICQGRLGGDPVLLNFYNSQSFTGDNKKCFFADVEQNKRPTFIVNENFTKPSTPNYFKNETSYALEIFANKLSLDYITSSAHNTTVTNSLESIKKAAINSSIVVSQRLHGLAFIKAIAPAVPIILHTPQYERLGNSIKFHSVAKTSIGFNKEIAYQTQNLTPKLVSKILDYPNKFLNQAHEQNFEKYRYLSFKCFNKIINLIKTT